jgi:hypothetical protein
LFLDKKERLKIRHIPPNKNNRVVMTLATMGYLPLNPFVGAFRSVTPNDVIPIPIKDRETLIIASEFIITPKKATIIPKPVPNMKVRSEADSTHD